uniref:Uncharacterized protein n=1 Tax=Rhizophora mucronata TaxID=61149 RepID=A0A2P2N3Z6_RHIMU
MTGVEICHPEQSRWTSYLSCRFLPSKSEDVL